MCGVWVGFTPLGAGTTVRHGASPRKLLMSPYPRSSATINKMLGRFEAAVARASFASAELVLWRTKQARQAIVYLSLQRIIAEFPVRKCLSELQL
jgi:hypothetical protein